MAKWQIKAKGQCPTATYQKQFPTNPLN